MPRPTARPGHGLSADHGHHGDMTDAAIVRTDSGPVRGIVADKYRLFQGIPYAASTAGEGRWRSPRPAGAWTQPRDATAPGSMCPQQPSSYADVASLEEDCLCLNVTTPRSADLQRPMPVMVWIHGDGAVGAGSFFDARRLATLGDVVVVTINYRLSIFGAFGHPGLAGSGAFGLEDQQAALRWVARNAAEFGGDPGNVTVFGESYGGLSTSAHLVAPASAGRFHRAIIQSGFALMDLPAGGIFPDLPAVAWFGWRPKRPVYAYEFADRQAPMYLPFPEDFPPGAFHAAEVPYVFPDEPFQAASTPEQRHLSDQMIRYWANFARDGDPNGVDLLPWQPFDAAQPVPYVQSLAPGPGGITPVDYAAEHRLDFWSTLP